MESLIRIVQSKRPLSSFFSVVPTFVPTVSAEGSAVGVAGSGSSTTGGVGSSGVGSSGVGSTGAVTATVGLIAPSVIVILIVAAFLQAFRDSKYVAGAFYGLRPASTALITAAGLVVVRETFWLTGGVLFWQGTVLAAVLLVLTRWVRQTKNWHPIVFIGLSALVGVVFRFAGA